MVEEIDRTQTTIPKGEGHEISLKIINLSPYTLEKVDSESGGMKSWDTSFPIIINAYTDHICHIKFAKGQKKWKRRVTGNVIYKICQMPFVLEVVAVVRVPSTKYFWQHSPDIKCSIEAKYPNMPLAGSILIPPNVDEYNYITDSTKKYGNLLICLPIEIKNIIKQSEESHKPWTKRWMEITYPAIKDLKLNEIFIPGTHNSGSYSMENSLAAHWTVCQNISITKQLELGVRSLDIRTGYFTKEKGQNRFKVIHDKYASKIRTVEVFNQVKEFIILNPSEFIILDFRRFILFQVGKSENITKRDLFEELSIFILHEIGDYLIPKGRMRCSYSELLSTLHPQQRIACCYEGDSMNMMFWPHIKQHWYRAETPQDVARELNKHFYAVDYTEIQKNQRERLLIWGSQPCIAPITGPKALPGLISEFFNGGIGIQSSPSLCANLVAVDFVENTGGFIQGGICANVVKGVLSQILFSLFAHFIYIRLLLRVSYGDAGYIT